MFPGKSMHHLPQDNSTVILTKISPLSSPTFIPPPNNSPPPTSRITSSPLISPSSSPPLTLPPSSPPLTSPVASSPLASVNSSSPPSSLTSSSRTSPVISSPLTSSQLTPSPLPSLFPVTSSVLTSSSPLTLSGLTSHPPLTSSSPRTKLVSSLHKSSSSLYSNSSPTSPLSAPSTSPLLAFSSSSSLIPTLASPQVLNKHPSSSLTSPHPASVPPSLLSSSSTSPLLASSSSFLGSSSLPYFSSSHSRLSSSVPTSFLASLTSPFHSSPDSSPSTPHLTASSSTTSSSSNTMQDTSSPQNSMQQRRRTETKIDKPLPKLLQHSASVAFAPFGILVASRKLEYEDNEPPPNSSTIACKKLHELKDLLLNELASLVGHERMARLYQNHAQRYHFLLGYADENRALGEEIRKQLEIEGEQQRVKVTGPWSVSLGELTISAWERLTSLSKKVVLLVSRELFQNSELTHFLMQMDTTLDITPVYLEPIREQDLPDIMKSLPRRNSRHAYNDSWDVQAFVRDLLAHYNFIHHLTMEIDLLKELVLQFTNNVAASCPCGEC